VNHNIAHTLTKSAALLGEQTGLIEAVSGREMSFRELATRSDSYAHLLEKKGIKPGTRVMLMVKPSADFICLTFALFKIGAPVILIDPGMGYKNLLRCIEGVGPVAFIGIPKAHLFRVLFRKPFTTVKYTLCLGNSLGLFGQDISQAADRDYGAYHTYKAAVDDLAAIIFTTGSTGPPKGVRYEHSIFQAQLRLIRDYYGIGPGQVDQPAFPLFALFSTALGATAVIPDMDPTRPAKVNPQRFVKSIEKYGVTYSFGSPAIWNVISRYCTKGDRRLKTLDKVLMAGAPVSGELISRMQDVLSPEASIHTPYGATESLPIVSIEGREITENTWQYTKKGKGTCVGRPLPGIEIAIIPVTDTVIPTLCRRDFLLPGVIGEIIVCGDVVTRGYENNKEENRMAKIADGDAFWHRMGDVGYLDEEGRLWFCGRRSHRVVLKLKNKIETLYTIPCEAIFNNHPDVFRSALVGVMGTAKQIVAVMVVEPEKGSTRTASQLITEMRKLGEEEALTSSIRHYLVHPDFPVDIRHNAKIFREKLSFWAAEELKGLI